MYNIVIRHLYTLGSDHPGKSSAHLEPHTVITIVLTTFSCCTLHPHDCFYNWQFLHLNAFPFFTHSPNLPPTWQPPKMSSVSMSLVLFCLFIYFVFRSYTQVKSYGICLSVWLISLRIMPSRSIHGITNGNISFFFLWLSNIPSTLLLLVGKY